MAIEVHTPGNNIRRKMAFFDTLACDPTVVHQQETSPLCQHCTTAGNPPVDLLITPSELSSLKQFASDPNGTTLILAPMGCEPLFINRAWDTPATALSGHGARGVRLCLCAREVSRFSLCASVYAMVIAAATTTDVRLKRSVGQWLALYSLKNIDPTPRQASGRELQGY